ncbi:MAG: hypothetical protein JW726_11950 [Anaerolineales bacterium]|nr:hypothetical protein [Anaerolineales bacterium]
MPSENILVYRPLEIASTLAPDVKPAGALLVETDTLNLLHFDPQVTVEPFELGSGSDLSASPDGKWLAYVQLSDSSPTGQWLIVESADRQQQYRIPIQMNLLYSGSYQWLDNQRLIFTLFEVDGPCPMVVINPFTGEQIELASDYPDLKRSPAGSQGSMAFNISDVVYDPSLNLAVYPQYGYGQPSYIVIRDRQSNSVLAKIEDKSIFEHYPLWSPNGTRLAVAVKDQQEGEKSIDEWFLVSREGEVEQATHFGDYFTKATIGPFNKWSPDNQKLAFWLETNTGPCEGANLAILDIATRQVTNTCVPSELNTYIPIWSLDSRYIVVINENEDPGQSILIDYEQSRAFDITAYGYPVGWLGLP